MPAIEDPIDTDEENAFREIAFRLSCSLRGLECAVSCGTFLATEVAVELAEQPVAIFGGPFGQIVDEGFDLLSAGIPQGFTPQKSTA